jgi:hypothetical protein
MPPIDNSGSHKEGVCVTYKGNDEFVSIAAYIVQEGLNVVQHGDN